MPTPTQYYSWSVPVENQDPWFEKMHTAFNAIDTSVSSVAMNSVPRVIIAVSMYMNPVNFTIEVSSATYTLHGADGSWTVLSAAPYGRAVGSFSLIHSGSQAFFDLRIGGVLSMAAGATPDFLGATTMYFRAVIRDGVNCYTVPTQSNSAWLHLMTIRGASIPTPSYIDIRSLGVGNYSVEIQARANFNQSSQTYVDANNGGWVTMTVRDTIR